MDIELLASRLDKLKRRGYYLIVPLDHGMSSGPVDGIATRKEFERTLVTLRDVPGVVLTVGANWLLERAERPSVVLQLIGMPDRSASESRRVKLSSPGVEGRFPHVAVAVQIDSGAPDRQGAVQETAEVIEEAHRISMPVLLMVVSNPHFYNKFNRDSLFSYLC